MKINVTRQTPIVSTAALVFEFYLHLLLQQDFKSYKDAEKRIKYLRKIAGARYRLAFNRPYVLELVTKKGVSNKMGNSRLICENLVIDVVPITNKRFWDLDISEGNFKNIPDGELKKAFEECVPIDLGAAEKQGIASVYKRLFPPLPNEDEILEEIKHLLAKDEKEGLSPSETLRFLELTGGFPPELNPIEYGKANEEAAKKLFKEFPIAPNEAHSYMNSKEAEQEFDIKWNVDAINESVNSPIIEGLKVLMNEQPEDLKTLINKQPEEFSRLANIVFAELWNKKHKRTSAPLVFMVLLITFLLLGWSLYKVAAFNIEPDWYLFVGSALVYLMLSHLVDISRRL